MPNNCKSLCLYLIKIELAHFSRCLVGQWIDRYMHIQIKNYLQEKQSKGCQIIVKAPDILHTFDQLQSWQLCQPCSFLQQGPSSPGLIQPGFCITPLHHKPLDHLLKINYIDEYHMYLDKKISRKHAYNLRFWLRNYSIIHLLCQSVFQSVSLSVRNALGKM